MDESKHMITIPYTDYLNLKKGYETIEGLSEVIDGPLYMKLRLAFEPQFQEVDRTNPMDKFRFYIKAKK